MRLAIPRRGRSETLRSDASMHGIHKPFVQFVSVVLTEEQNDLSWHYIGE